MKRLQLQHLVACSEYPSTSPAKHHKIHCIALSWITMLYCVAAAVNEIVWPASGTLHDIYKWSYAALLCKQMCYGAGELQVTQRRVLLEYPQRLTSTRHCNASRCIRTYCFASQFVCCRHIMHRNMPAQELPTYHLQHKTFVRKACICELSP